MRYFLATTLLVGTLLGNAQQTNLVFFAEGGENFTLYVNGSQQNDAPTSRVEAKGITGDMGAVKIVFETPGAPEISKPMMLESDMEMTVMIRKNRKGKFVLLPVSTSPISEGSATETVQINQPVQQSTTTTISTSSTATQNTTAGNTSSNSTNIGVNLNVGGQTVGMDVNVSGMENAMDTPSGDNSNNSPDPSSPSGAQLSARVDGSNILLSDGRAFAFEYVRNSGNMPGVKTEFLDPANANVKISLDGKTIKESEIPFIWDGGWSYGTDYMKYEVTEPNGNQWSFKIQNKNGYMLRIKGSGGGSATTTTTQAAATTGCSTPMSSGDFDKAKGSISGKTFGDDKMTVFKQILRSNCLSVNQVVEVMGLFTYEEEKLDVAKMAYAKTVDKGNYYQVNEAFTYSSSIEELEAFLQKQ